MKLEINITKGKFWTLSLLLILAIGVFVLAASSTVPNPGHAKGDIEGLTDLESRVVVLEKKEIWPTGSYCIWKKGECPAGFTLASMTIDGEDTGQDDWKGGGPIGDSNMDGKANYNINACCK